MTAGRPCRFSASRAADDDPAADQAAGKVTMTTLGKIGLFGDQVMQYAFLRIYARSRGLDVEVPHWDGRLLFGHDGAGLARPGGAYADGNGHLRLGVDAMAPVIAEYLGVDWKRLFGVLVRKQRLAVTDVGIDFLKGDDLLRTDQSGACRDLLGWFQFDTRFYRPHQQFFRALFRPQPEIDARLTAAWDRISTSAGTVVGLHLRRGDRLNLPMNTNEWIAPVDWYQRWLEENWHTLDNPVLFLASDSIGAVRGHFAKYRPLTSADLLGGLSAPANGLPDGTPGYYPDFYFLSRCDIGLISNSMFSFTAAMLNDTGRLFLRPVLAEKRLRPFDPWHDKPILRRTMDTSFLRRYGEYLEISYLAAGWQGVVTSALWRIPRFWCLRAALNAVAAAYGRNIRFGFNAY